MSHPAGKIFIVSGISGAGKTRFCSRLSSIARQHHLVVKGLICPAIFEGGRKTAIQVVDLETDEKFTLARAKIALPGGSVHDHWEFNEEVMRWCNSRLGSLKDCDLAIVDELGPLEFEHGGGWQQGLKMLDRGEFTCALVVIRPGLIEIAKKRWTLARVLEVSESMQAGADAELQKVVLKEFLEKAP